MRRGIGGMGFRGIWLERLLRGEGMDSIWCLGEVVWRRCGWLRGWMDVHGV